METTGFRTARRGTNAAQAFAEAVEEARRNRRAASIANKTDFVVIGDENDPATFAAAHTLATRLLREHDPRIWDVHGPAGAIPVKTLRDERVQVPVPPGVYDTDAAAIRAAIDGYRRDGSWQVVNRPRILRGPHVHRTYLAAAEYGTQAHAPRGSNRFRVHPGSAIDLVVEYGGPVHTGWLFFGRTEI